MIRIQVALLIVLAGLAGGCAATIQARDVQPSGFLDEHRALLQPGPEDGMLRAYINSSAQWDTYNNIILEPVTIWDGFSLTLDHEQRYELKRMADSFYKRLYLKLAKDYDMVEEPTAGTIRIRMAITHAEKSWTAPAFLSKLIIQLQAVNTLWSLASGKPAFAGEITVELKMYDAQTGEVLVAGADRRVGGQKLFDREIFNSWGDAKNSLEFWVDHSAYRLCVLRGGTTCVGPDA